MPRKPIYVNNATKLEFNSETGWLYIDNFPIGHLAPNEVGKEELERRFHQYILEPT